MSIRYYSLILVLMMCSSGIFGIGFQSSSDTINQIDAKGQKQGYWKKQDAKGNPVFEGYFKNNKPVGEFKRYYPKSDKLKAIMIFTEDKKEIYTKMFFENGKLMGEGEYVNKIKEGKWKYYSKMETLILDETYVNGKKDGFSKKYYKNGEYSDVTQWKEGIKDGVWKQYFENCRVKLESKHENNKRVGDFKMYYSSGEIELKGKYVDDKLHGVWFFYNKKGDVVKEIEYRYGKALNEDELEKAETEKLEKIEQMRGKIEEPTNSLYKY